MANGKQPKEETGALFVKITLILTLSFWPFIAEGRRVHKLYFSTPPEWDWDVLASLLEHLFVICTD